MNIKCLKTMYHPSIYLAKELEMEKEKEKKLKEFVIENKLDKK